MRSLGNGVVFVAFLTGCAAPASGPVWANGPDLPMAVANNAVAGAVTAQGPTVFSFMGIDSTKAWDGVRDWAFSWTLGDPAWRTLAPVPGPGRLAATAQGWRGRVFLFGGYTVAEDGSERSLPTVDIYDPATDQWTVGAPIPRPVDDAVSGLWGDSLIVLVSGWHDGDNVRDVQVYDPARDSWRASTPIPGAPVFGHTGAVAGDLVVYVDGARVRAASPRFVVDTASWLGRLAPEGAIAWEAASPHPGPPLYRAAAVGLEDWVLFAGGTDNPYNYDGIGYDGRPAQPRSQVFAYHLPSASWRLGQSLPRAMMDHRGLVDVGTHILLVGGMEEGQRVSRRVFVADRTALLGTLRTH